MQPGKNRTFSPDFPAGMSKFGYFSEIDVLGIIGMRLSPIAGFMSGAHAVCGAFFWSRKNSGWNGRPTFTKNANSFGLQSITRKAIFLIGLSPMYARRFRGRA